MKNMEKWNGTIARALNDRMSELEPLLQSPSQFGALKVKVNEIISNADLNRKEDGERAIRILSKINKYSLYLSSLAAYMSGMTVS